jgi:hypothetical protein
MRYGWVYYFYPRDEGFSKPLYGIQDKMPSAMIGILFVFQNSRMITER